MTTLTPPPVHDRKTCSTCKTEKPYSDFHKDANYRDGLRTRCKVCVGASSAAYRAENPEKVKAKKAAYYTANPEKVKAYGAVYNLTPAGRFTGYKTSAKNRNISFNLSKEQFLSFWQKDCTYCGRPIPTIGLDRVDSSIGYEIDNVVSCCTSCNTMKMDSTMEEWLTNMWMVMRHLGVNT